jgi:hypothetical protein
MHKTCSRRHGEEVTQEPTPAMYTQQHCIKCMCRLQANHKAVA